MRGATPLRMIRTAFFVTSLALASVATAQQHWAYRKPMRPAVPTGEAHPIDAFVRKRLAARGMGAATQANRATLLRRVHLDLVGLPPSVDELDAFLLDKSANAYEKVVDRLLASPRFGEHHARPWLDLARYADSNGFQADQLRESWAYRDWVIQALNDDMPFDRFTIEQIAGDLLPEPTLAQRIATGFHRTVTCNVEAGVHPEANRVNQVVDRVNTTATVWLGTTFSCAQCHEHKYDPFSQKEYFEVFAFFNNTPLEVRNPLGKEGVRFDFYGPKVELPLSAAQKAELAKLESQLEKLRGQRATIDASSKTRRDAWIARARAAVRKQPGWRPLEVVGFESTGDEDHEILEDRSVLVGGRVPDTTTYRVRVRSKLRGITAFRLETLTHASLPGSGPGRSDEKRPNFILSEFGVALKSVGEGTETAIKLHSASADYSQKQWHVAQAIDGNPRKGWAIGGRFFKDHHAVFQSEKAIDCGDDGELVFTLDQNFGRGRTIGRFRLSAYVGDPVALDLPPRVARALRKRSPNAAETKRIHAHYRAKDAGAAALARRIADIKKRIAAVKPSTSLVMVEQQTPRVTKVMARGDYLQPGETVSPKTPKVLHAWREEWPRNRLGLARWLVDRDNPLVARVTVNRWWARIFGRGLVTTEEDFGTRGARPSHPELLDWLAVEFMDKGWSRKHILRLIVTSKTYQQSSKRSSENIDADNAWLARGPRFRMSAEMIRDNALAVSGLLSTKMGGPPVFPPQPAGLWRQTGRNEPKYIVATNEDRFRRGIYVIWRRAAPYPSFVLFDGPDRAECHPKRSRTNTPMQALALMNDETYVEIAMALAQRVLRDVDASGDELSPRERNEARVAYTFRRVLLRDPSAREREHVVRVVERELARFGRDGAAAKRLIDGVRGVRIEPGIDQAELAAWFYAATILLNLDETITKG